MCYCNTSSFCIPWLQIICPVVVCRFHFLMNCRACLQVVLTCAWVSCRSTVTLCKCHVHCFPLKWTLFVSVCCIDWKLNFHHVASVLSRYSVTHYTADHYITGSLAASQPSQRLTTDWIQSTEIQPHANISIICRCILLTKFKLRKFVYDCHVIFLPYSVILHQNATHGMCDLVVPVAKLPTYLHHRIPWFTYNTFGDHASEPPCYNEAALY